MRKKEQQDVAYHFVTEEHFKQMTRRGLFGEWTNYSTEFGEWYYGTALRDLENADEKSIIILTPIGYKSIVDKLSEKPKSIYIYANDETIKERLLKRGDNKDEAQRRLQHDNEDFIGIENDANYVFYNDKGTNINELVREIVKVIEGDKL